MMRRSREPQQRAGAVMLAARALGFDSLAARCGEAEARAARAEQALREAQEAAKPAAAEEPAQAAEASPQAAEPRPAPFSLMAALCGLK